MHGVYLFAAFLFFSLTHTTDSAMLLQNTWGCPASCSDLRHLWHWLVPPGPWVERVMVRPLQAHSSCYEIHSITFFFLIGGKSTCFWEFQRWKQKDRYPVLYIIFLKCCVSVHLIIYDMLFIYIFGYLESAPLLMSFWWITLPPFVGPW